MLTAEENDLLTQTGAETPMGQYFRRFWQPVALSREMPERDGPPIRVTVMGEELVAFRDSQGRVGLIDTLCPHRGADMFYGRNEECGLRCVYHGWKFDVTGKPLDLPNVPPGVRHHETVRIKAYPT
ncbi:MAG: Rieske 2Fe-2S domain-containing protein, partial [Rickettsiales bacterium]